MSASSVLPTTTGGPSAPWCSSGLGLRPFIASSDWAQQVKQLREQPTWREAAAAEAERQAANNVEADNHLRLLASAVAHTPGSSPRQRAYALALLAHEDVEGARDGLLLAIELGDAQAPADYSRLAPPPAPPWGLRATPAQRQQRARRAETAWAPYALAVATHDSLDDESVLQLLRSPALRSPFVIQGADVHGLSRWGHTQYQSAFESFPARLMASRSGIFSYFNPKTVRVRGRGLTPPSVTPSAFTGAGTAPLLEPRCASIHWAAADPLLRYAPIVPADNASRCCSPHHVVAIAEHDAWAALAAEAAGLDEAVEAAAVEAAAGAAAEETVGRAAGAAPVLERGEAIYLRLHFPRQHPDAVIIQTLLSPRALAANLSRMPQGRYALYLSNAGTVTNLHYDADDGLLHQLTGRKSVALWAPKDAHHLRTCGDACGSICRRRSQWDGELPPMGGAAGGWPGAGVPPYHVILEPGQTLFIPQGWLHYVTSLSTPTASYVFSVEPWRGL